MKKLGVIILALSLFSLPEMARGTPANPPKALGQQVAAKYAGAQEKVPAVDQSSSPTGKQKTKKKKK
jgi:hypothetical protein